MRLKTALPKKQLFPFCPVRFKNSFFFQKGEKWNESFFFLKRSKWKISRTFCSPEEESSISNNTGLNSDMKEGQKLNENDISGSFLRTSLKVIIFLLSKKVLKFLSICCHDPYAPKKVFHPLPWTISFYWLKDWGDYAI